MKHLRRFTAILLVFCLMLTDGLALIPAAWAEEIRQSASTAPVSGEITSSDGWIYRLTAEDDAVLMGYTDTSVTSLTLPKAVDGHWVVAVGENAFANHASLTALRAPASISRWADSAFPAASRMKVSAYNGSGALRFAASRGLQINNLSRYDFFEEVLDLSEISSSQYSLSGGTLTVRGPWAHALRQGGRLYLPAGGGYKYGVPLRVSSLTVSVDTARATVYEIDIMEALRTYRAENVALYPDWSRAVPLAEGVEIMDQLQPMSKDGEASVSRSLQQQIDLELKLTDRLTASGNVTIGPKMDLTIDFGFFTINEMKLTSENTFKIDVTLKDTSTNIPIKLPNNSYQKAKEIDKTKTILKVPMVGEVLASVWLEIGLGFTIEGEVKLWYEVTSSNSVTWKDGNLTCNKTEPIRKGGLDVSAAAKLEFKAAFTIKLGFTDHISINVAELSLRVGIEGKIAMSTQTMGCADLTLTGYLKADFKLGVFSEKIDYTLYSGSILDLSFDIFKGHFEFDTLSFVKECTKKNECTVTLYTGGRLKDVLQLTVTVQKFNKMEYPGTPKRDGYTFDGWYTDMACTRIWDFSNSVTADMILYAKWIKEGSAENTEHPDSPNPTGTAATPSSTITPSPTPRPTLTPQEQAMNYILYEISEDHVVITGTKNNPELLVLPDEIEGLPVTEIGKSAFSRCWTLKAIELPSSVVRINEYAFNDCDGLTQVTLHEGLKEIDSLAFYSCDYLEELHVPDSVEIMNQPFSSCYSIKSVNYPKNLKTAYSPFSGVKTDKIVVPEGVTELPSRVFSDISCEVVLPNTLKKINKEAFYWAGILQITIPDSVETIEDYAFHCSSVVVVNLNEGIKNINDHAFDNCKNLKSIVLPDSLETLGHDVFEDCSSLKSINYPRNIQFSDYPLEGWYGSVIIPEGVEELKNGVLALSNIEELVMPNSLKKIDDYALQDCKLLRNVKLNDGLLTIGEGAFWNCSMLSELYLPDTIETIGRYPLTGTAIKEITLPRNIKTLSIGGIYRNVTLKKVIVPEGVEIIPDDAFSRTNIETVDLPSSLKSIGSEAFQDMPNLLQITLPNGLEKIGNNAFCMDENLCSVVFPSTLTEIGTDAFSGCKRLTEINLPEGLKSIGSSAFSGTSLVTVYIPNSVETIGEIAFGSMLNMETLYYPISLISENRIAYPASFSDSSFSIVIPEGVENIPANVFRYSYSNNIVLPSSLKTIGKQSFQGNSIESIVIPPYVENIENLAFGNCKSLDTIAFWCDDAVWYQSFKNGAWSGCPIRRILVTDINSPYVKELTDQYQYKDIEIVQLPPTLINVAFMDGEHLHEYRMGRSGGRLAPAEDPVKAGYLFTGWYREPECYTLWDFENDLQPARDLYLYAGWAAAPEAFTFEIADGRATVLHYNGEDAQVEIPAEIGGHPVTGLGAGAFGPGVTAVALPASVTEIDPEAFHFASDLMRITAAGDRYTADDGILYEGDKLLCYPAGRTDKSFSIPRRVTALGGYAFSGVSALRSLRVPSSVKTLDGFAIYDCPALRTVVFDGAPTGLGMGCLWDCADWLGVYGPIEAETLASYCRGISVPYNMYEVVYMEGDRELGSALVRAGALLSNVMEAVDGEKSFRGWALDKEGTALWDMDSDTMPEDDLTLYAVWAYDFKAESVSGGVRLTEYIGKKTEIVVPEAMDGVPVVAIADGCFGSAKPTLRGNRGSVADAFAAAHGLTFTPFTYTLTYECNGGTLADAQTLCATDAVPLPTPVKTGFSLVGWYSDPAFTEPWTADMPMPAHDLTLYAGWLQTDENAREVCFTFENAPGGLVITGYTGDEDEVTVPAQINGQAVVAIAPDAFAGLPTLRAVTLPDSVTAVGEGAFQGCGALLSVRLPQGLETLEANTFAGCEWLTDLTLPAAVKYVRAYAFYGCRALPAVQLGSAVEDVDTSAFRGCASLSSISAGGLYYASVDGVLYDHGLKTLILYPEGKQDAAFAVPDGTETIRSEAMYASRVQTLTLPDSLTAIGDGALTASALLREIVFGAGLDTVGESAFSECRSLRAVTLPDSLRSLSREAFHLAPLATLTVGSAAALDADCVDKTDALTICGHAGSDAQRYADAHGIRFLDLDADIPLQSLTLPETLELTVGQVSALTLQKVPENASASKLIWASSDPSVADVDQTGRATAYTPGETVFTVTGDGGITASCTVTVSRAVTPLSGLALPAEGIRVDKGDAASVLLQLIPQNAMKPALTWATADPGVAVYYNGCVLGVGLGSTTLTVTAEGGITASCTVTVVSPQEKPAFGAPDFIPPQALKTVGEEAFAGIAATVIRLPQGVTEISSRAFADCAHLLQIYIPADCETIDAHAFDGCSAALQIFAPEGSAAQRFAQSAGFQFVAAQ